MSLKTYPIFANRIDITRKYKTQTSPEPYETKEYSVFRRCGEETTSYLLQKKIDIIKKYIRQGRYEYLKEIRNIGFKEDIINEIQRERDFMALVNEKRITINMVDQAFSLLTLENSGESYNIKIIEFQIDDEEFEKYYRWMGPDSEKEIGSNIKQMK
jgi:hypothetical protein